MTKLQEILNKFNANLNIKNNCINDAQKAYTISAIQKGQVFEDLYNKFITYCHETIKEASSNGYTETYIKCPNWLLLEQKEKAIQELTKLGYSILYNSEKSIIISWDFKLQKI